MNRKGKMTRLADPNRQTCLKSRAPYCTQSSAGINHVVYYHEGVGTAGGLDKITGGAFGNGMAHNIPALYRVLVSAVSALPTLTLRYSELARASPVVTGG